MIKHIVQPGDTVYALSNRYGISPNRLIIENELTNPDTLAIGETLLIVYPKQTYIVREGDTLLSIADAHGVSWLNLLRNNPNIADREELIIGEEIVINFEDEKNYSISVNGYAFPYISMDVLRKTLPFLTYLTIIGYQILSDGSIDNIDDVEIIQLARDYGVASIMEIFTFTVEESIENNAFHTILHDTALQNILIRNILTTLRSKGYYGASIDTPYILPDDKYLYVEFIENLTRQLNREGFLLIATLLPSTFEVATGITYMGTDYAGIGRAANNVIYNLSYDWSNPFELTKDALSFQTITQAIANASTHVPPEKLLLGVTSIGYSLILPYIPGTTVTTFINHTNAVNLAREFGIAIQFNETNQVSYLHYSEGDLEYMVLFKDVNSMAAYPDIIRKYNLSGISFWNIMYYFPRTWLLFHSQFEINKVLPPI